MQRYEQSFEDWSRPLPTVVTVHVLDEPCPLGKSHDGYCHSRHHLDGEAYEQPRLFGESGR